MRKFIGAVIVAAAFAFGGAAAMSPATAAPQRSAVHADQGKALTDVSAQRRYRRHYHHRHYRPYFYGPRYYRPYYRHRPYYRPYYYGRPYYYRPYYYGPRPFVGFSFGFGPRWGW